MTDRRNRIAFGLIVASGLFAAQPRLAWSHAADEMLAPSGGTVIAPRTEARVGQVEMVAIFSKQIFAVFLSRYADGGSVIGASVEASTDLQSATLTETDPGLYSTRELLMAPGNNDVAIKFVIDGVTKTHTLALKLPSDAPEASAPQPGFLDRRSGTIVASILAISILAPAIFLLARRRLPQRTLGRTTTGGLRT